MRYSNELRDSVLRRVLPPQDDPIDRVSREVGISEQTIRNWKIKALSTGFHPDNVKDSVPDKWSSQDKFHIVVETMKMTEVELAEYAREKGIFVEQITQWRDICLNANGGMAREAARLNRELKYTEKRNRHLEHELVRKEKALAEAAALMLLRKKLNAILGDPEAE